MIITLDLERELAEMQRSAERALTPALVDAAGLIADEARAEHPYTDRSGELTASIVAGEVHEQAEGATVTLVAEAEHASYVNEGTERMEARPFLRPAFERREDDAAAVVAERIARDIP